MSVIGVPIKVLHEAEGHIVTVETTTGEVRPLIIRLSKKRLKDSRSFNVREVFCCSAFTEKKNFFPFIY